MLDVKNKDLAEHYKIIQRFIKCYAGQGDAVSARQAVESIIPAAEQGDVTTQFLLGRYYSWGYHSDCDDRKAIYWFKKAADSGNAEAAQFIMEIYRDNCPDDIDAEQQNVLILKMALAMVRYAGRESRQRFGWCSQRVDEPLYRRVSRGYDTGRGRCDGSQMV